MILAIDIGNTNIVLGGITDGNIDFMSRVSTDKKKTVDEYGVTLSGILALYGCNAESVEGVVIASVVPPVLHIIEDAVRRVTGIEPLVIGPGVRTGMNILMDNPSTVGTDMIVCAVAALQKYKAPIIIVDMGTATTISVVDSDGNYIGGNIMPGLLVSYDAISSRTAQLPHVSLDTPKNIIGKNTIDCMHSGMIYGTAATIDGCIDRMEEELGESASLVITGGLGKFIAPHCKHKIDYNDELLLDGLYYIYKKNTQ